MELHTSVFDYICDKREREERIGRNEHGVSFNHQQPTTTTATTKTATPTTTTTNFDLYSEICGQSSRREDMQFYYELLLGVIVAVTSFLKEKSTFSFKWFFLLFTDSKLSMFFMQCSSNISGKFFNGSVRGGSQHKQPPTASTVTHCLPASILNTFT